MGFFEKVEKKRILSFNGRGMVDGGIIFELDKKRLVHTSEGDRVKILWSADRDHETDKSIEIIVESIASNGETEPIHESVKKFYKPDVLKALAWLEDVTV